MMILKFTNTLKIYMDLSSDSSSFATMSDEIYLKAPGSLSNMLCRIISNTTALQHNNEKQVNHSIILSDSSYVIVLKCPLF